MIRENIIVVVIKKEQILYQNWSVKSIYINRSIQLRIIWYLYFKFMISHFVNGINRNTYPRLDESEEEFDSRITYAYIIYVKNKKNNITQ